MSVMAAKFGAIRFWLLQKYITLLHIGLQIHFIFYSTFQYYAETSNVFNVVSITNLVYEADCIKYISTSMPANVADHLVLL